jgi:hypothetical protein
LRSQVHVLNESLQRQEQEKMHMRRQLQRQDNEMKETNKKLYFFMQHLRFTDSSSHPPQANNEDEDGDNEFQKDLMEDDNNDFEDLNGEDNDEFEDLIMEKITMNLKTLINFHSMKTLI